MKMIPTLCAIAFSSTIVCLPAYARWEPFTLCKHTTGQPVKNYRFEGIQIEGTFWLNTSTADIESLAQVSGGKCVMIYDRSGREQITVTGTLQEVYCKLAGGPSCARE